MTIADLSRFVTAQSGVFEAVRAELAAGRKRTHWMWFVFPQIEGLGASRTARAYAIRSLAEANAYLDHDVLGPRLRDCTSLALGCGVTDAHTLFGSPDDLKFRSSMTLFAVASDRRAPFTDALSAFFAGQDDMLTLQRLARL